MKKNIQQWIAYARQNRRMIFFYEQKVLDLTQFANLHPGGKKALTNYLYKDITDILFKVYPHQKEHTLNKLFHYILGTTDLEINKNPKTQKSTRQITIKQKKKVCFERNSDINQNKQQNSTQDKQKSNNKTKDNSKQKNKSKNKNKQNKSKQKTQKNQKSSVKTCSKKSTAIQSASNEVNKKEIENQFSQDVQFNEQLDEQKPNFKVRIQTFRQMNHLQP